MTIVTSAAASPPRGTLALSEMKNRFSVAFLEAVAAHAGIEVWTSPSDFNGVDAMLRTYARYPSRAGATLDIQLKCTSQEAVKKDDHIAWSLEGATYRKLTDPNRFSVSILAVLVVPGDLDEWMDQDEDRLLSKSCMYFSNASDWDPIDPDAGSKVVKCPRTNILNVTSLLELMQESASMSQL